MNLSFKRITSTGNFIPEIDGLRFIAISSVVLYHYWLFFDVKDKTIYDDSYQYSFFEQLLSHGKFGVPLFFVISGFILGLPFAKSHLINSKAINIRTYFTRRLTRLEPPYIVAMTALLFGSVLVANTIDWQGGILSYLASIFYIHNFVYPGVLPFLNSVAWSLEVEVQFYILAPVIAQVFRVAIPKTRRIIIIGLIIIFIVLNHLIALPFVSLFNYIQYFLAGFLLVDFFLTKTYLFPKSAVLKFITLFLLFGIWLFDTNDFAILAERIIWDVFQLTCVFFLYYFILQYKVLRFFSYRLVTNIGGMCYSIYLIHYAIISLVGNWLLTYSLSNYAIMSQAIRCIILTICISVVCSLFYLLIERPCMDKNWVKKLFKYGKYSNVLASEK